MKHLKPLIVVVAALVIALPAYALIQARLVNPDGEKVYTLDDKTAFTLEVVEEVIEEMLGGGGTRDFASFSTHIASASTDNILRIGAGVLGRVTITNSPQSAFILYNATTTNANLRTITATSSLKVLASFPASATVGTYDFDAAFSQGLIFVPEGLIGSTTILYK